MSGAVVLHHQEHVVSSARAWRGSRLAASARLTTPTLHRRLRAAGDDGPGIAVRPTRVRQSTLGMVLRQWSGVLAIFGLIVVVGLVVVILGAWAFGYRPVVVTSGSMAPAVRAGDIVITKPVGVDDEVGDQTVVDFIDPATDERKLHRVIEVTPSGYRTKGDANQSADTDVVPPDHVRGAGFILAPYIGYLPLWLGQQDWIRLGAASATLATLAAMSSRRWMWGAQP